MTRRTGLGLSILLGAGLLAIGPPQAVAAAARCRVRNVTQDTSGTSLIGMVGEAADGDRLLVQGTGSRLGQSQDRM